MLVCLHDGLGSVETLRSLPEALGEKLGIGAFAYDRHGYGRSDSADRFPTLFMEGAAETLPKILRATGIDDYVIFGHSDGGTIALLHAATGPKGLRALVSVAAHITLDHLTHGQVLRHQEMVDTGEIPSFMPHFHGDRAAALLAAWTAVWQHPLYQTWDVGPVIAALRAPLLALQGGEDIYGLPDQLRGIKAAVPAAETRLLPGIGHFPHVENPALLVEIVVEFLAPHCRA